ncbi:helix-turn-helix domain-containing protein [Pontibacter sp. G13]|uniref:helix-turn-helix transcriptional regulator n=1 Tax=Pontibacter sp. G13 TaxID=3074898 RepID=UPI00288B4CF4|nr:helix-turn-helix domain-containing protein [Pontibacter sp. G13]WNJ17706.1 helix-turn-helix domain-containing protein [Pontibacter sp. G13]
MKISIFTWAIIQSFLVGVSIFSVKIVRINLYLSLYFIAVSLKIFVQYLMRFTLWKAVLPHILFLPDVIDLLEPVLLFLYINSLLGNRFQRRDYLYFLPPAIALIGLSAFALITPNFGFPSYLGTALHIFVLAFITIYKGGFLYKSMEYVQGLKETAVKLKQKKVMLWLRMLIWFMALGTFVAFLMLAYHTLIVQNLGQEAKEAVRLGIEFTFIIINASVITITGVFLLKNPQVLQAIPFVKPKNDKDFPEGKFFLNRLDKLIQQEQVFLDANLNEKALATQLEIQPYLLSKLLNEYIGKSFSAFVNEHRIEYAKKLLLSEEGRKLTVFAVAVDSGFNSESVFYVNFKKLVGMTPTQFKKKHLSPAMIKS